MNEQSQLKRFRIGSPVQDAICIVEATTADEALLRAALVARESRKLTPDVLPVLSIEEMHEQEPATLPYYRDGYFLMIELRDNGCH